MKKYLLSFVFLASFVGYALLRQLNGAGPDYAAAQNQSAPAQSSSDSQPAAPAQASALPVSVPAPALTQANNPAPAPQPKKGLYADGTYTGSTEDAFYGYVQVRVIVSGGKMASVQFLKYPNDRSTSRFINQQAMPLLTQEAIRAQSAEVDGVSGASDTSDAFRQSLASALAKAKS